MSKETGIKYAILKKDKDINKATLRKYGLFADLNLHDIAATIRDQGKMLTEMNSNIAINKAMLENIKKHHAFVTKMKELELKIASVFITKSEELKNFEADRTQIKKNLKSIGEELKIINSQLGIKEETVADLAFKEVSQIKDIAGEAFKAGMKKNKNA